MRVQKERTAALLFKQVEIYTYYAYFRTPSCVSKRLHHRLVVFVVCSSTTESVSSHLHSRYHIWSYSRVDIGMGEVS